MLGYIIDHQRAEGQQVDVEWVSGLALGLLQAGTDTSAAGFNGLLVILAQV